MKSSNSSSNSSIRNPLSNSLQCSLTLKITLQTMFLWRRCQIKCKRMCNPRFVHKCSNNLLSLRRLAFVFYISLNFVILMISCLSSFFVYQYQVPPVRGSQTVQVSLCQSLKHLICVLMEHTSLGS